MLSWTLSNAAFFSLLLCQLPTTFLLPLPWTPTPSGISWLLNLFLSDEMDMFLRSPRSTRDPIKFSPGTPGSFASGLGLGWTPSLSPGSSLHTCLPVPRLLYLRAVAVLRVLCLLFQENVLPSTSPLLLLRVVLRFQVESSDLDLGGPLWKPLAPQYAWTPEVDKKENKINNNNIYPGYLLLII